MGVGDDIMATGLARGAAKRGKRVAFGDGKKILWGPFSEIAFRNNPNIAPPGNEGAKDLEWIDWYKGKRHYNSVGDGRWIWNYNWRARPGEIFMTMNEIEAGRRCGSGFVVIEPNVPRNKSVANNKQWPFERYQEVAYALMYRDHRRVLQFCYDGMLYRLNQVTPIKTTSFRDAMAILSNAALYIGPEGGLHHAAAALGIPAVVIFGGFIPPEVTGYDMHTNLTGGAKACGSLKDCDHCKRAMQNIGVDHVVDAAREYLKLRVAG